MKCHSSGSSPWRKTKPSQREDAAACNHIYQVGNFLPLLWPSRHFDVPLERPNGIFLEKNVFPRHLDAVKMPWEHVKQRQEHVRMPREYVLQWREHDKQSREHVQ
jgi:hypothetical protein